MSLLDLYWVDQTRNDLSWLNLTWPDWICPHFRHPMHTIKTPSKNQLPRLQFSTWVGGWWWGGGWFMLQNHATLWPTLQAGTLQDFKQSWNSQVGQSVAIIFYSLSSVFCLSSSAFSLVQVISPKSDQSRTLNSLWTHQPIHNNATSWPNFQVRTCKNSIQVKFQVGQSLAPYLKLYPGWLAGWVGGPTYIIMPLCGPTCKWGLARTQVRLSSKLGRVWLHISSYIPGGWLAGWVVPPT